MFPASIIPFLKDLDTFPLAKIREFLRLSGKPAIADYLINDYESDCIGFFSRNLGALARAIDDYNGETADEYFSRGEAVPKPIEYGAVAAAIQAFARWEPINILYEIQSHDVFTFAGHHFESKEFRTLSLDNLKFDILSAIMEESHAAHAKLFA